MAILNVRCGTAARTCLRETGDFLVTRLLAIMAVAIYSLACASLPARGQADTGADSRCFPWQEFRDGACAAKPAPDTATPPTSQSRQLTTTPREDPPPPPPPPPVAAPVAPPPIPAPAPAPVAAVPMTILCDGGTVSGGACNCPAGYALLPAGSGSGGICARSHAENCRGGELTVGGVCLCSGRVTMSGETYALEFVGGKCVPKRCPERSYLRDGKCVASNDTRLSFTCRTGYIPDEGNPASGSGLHLHCVPDPTFCPPGTKQKGGACGKSAAIAIDCFADRCTCGPNADWVNYLCQCTAPYRNVNGSCVDAATAESGGSKLASKPEAQASEPPPRRKACGRGMVRTRSGACVVARQRLPDPGAVVPYYERAYRYPGAYPMQ